MILGWLRDKIANSPSVVTTGPGVLKTHDVECRFYTEADNRKRVGKLRQDRWSDGQERFSLVLRDLPKGTDPVMLFRGDEMVSEFEREGSTFEFRWKGISSDAIPKFSIGDHLMIEVGGESFLGIVEAD